MRILPDGRDSVTRGNSRRSAAAKSREPIRGRRTTLEILNLKRGPRLCSVEKLGLDPSGSRASIVVTFTTSPQPKARAAIQSGVFWKKPEREECPAPSDDIGRKRSGMGLEICDSDGFGPKLDSARDRGQTGPWPQLILVRQRQGRTALVASMAHSPSTAPARDERIYSAIQQGSADWKRMLFDEYSGLVRGLLIKCIGPQAEVDDLSAEVFLGLFESAKNIRSADGMRSYIVSVTMNTARREFRRRKRRSILFFRDDSDEMVDRAAGTDDPKAKAALIQLHRILEELSTEERMVFALHVLEEIPLGQVAENLSISLSTAKRRLKRSQERVHRRVLKNPLLADYILDKARESDD